MRDAEALQELFEESGVKAGFRRRAAAIPGDLRIAWRLPVLCLIVEKFRRSSATAECLHAVWWAIRSKETRNLFLRWQAGDKRPDELIVRFDPSLTLTVDLARGEGLIVTSETGAILLTPLGSALSASVWEHEALLGEEKGFLRELPTLNQTIIRELLVW